MQFALCKDASRPRAEFQGSPDDKGTKAEGTEAQSEKIKYSPQTLQENAECAEKKSPLGGFRGLN